MAALVARKLVLKSRSVTAAAYTVVKNTHSVSNGNGAPVPNELITGPEIIPYGKVVKFLVEKGWDHLKFGRHSPRARQTLSLADELEYKVPMPGLNESQIEMTLTPKNRVIFVGNNKEDEVFYKDKVDLPRNGDFQHAKFTATLDKGVVTMKVHGCARTEKKIYFDH